jgi:hypothetical protein
MTCRMSISAKSGVAEGTGRVQTTVMQRSSLSYSSTLTLSLRSLPAPVSTNIKVIELLVFIFLVDNIL